jgi:hypothetical protein
MTSQTDALPCLVVDEQFEAVIAHETFAVHTIAGLAGN